MIRARDRPVEPEDRHGVEILSIDRLSRRPHDERADLLGAEMQLESRAVRGWLAAQAGREVDSGPKRDEDPRRDGPTSRTGEDLSAMQIRHIDGAEQERGPATFGTLDGPAMDLDLAHADAGAAGSATSSEPGSTGPSRSVPVTTVPRPFTEKTRSIASLADGRSAAPGIARSRRATSAARRSSRPVPVTPDAARIGDARERGRGR